MLLFHLFVRLYVNLNMAEEINVCINLPEKIFTLWKIDFNLESFGLGFGLGLGDIM